MSDRQSPILSNATEFPQPSSPSTPPSSDRHSPSELTELPPILQTYFTEFNRGEWAAVSQLFAPDGILHAPFAETVVGRDAIAAYLHSEAQGMIVFPHRSQTELLSGDRPQVQVLGTVQTAWFSLNVTWLFILDPASQSIHALTLRLLASPQELLQIRRPETP